MIVGLAIARVDVARFRAAAERRGARLAARLFSERERASVGWDAARPAHAAERLAVRFAAKLAARRALGAAGLRWREVEVIRGPGGAPRLALHGRAAEAAGRRGAARTSLTLTHTREVALAQVLCESVAVGA